MDVATFAVEAEAEATQWWFVGRRLLFTSELKQAGVLNPTDRVLASGPALEPIYLCFEILVFGDVQVWMPAMRPSATVRPRGWARFARATSAPCPSPMEASTLCSRPTCWSTWS